MTARIYAQGAKVMMAPTESERGVTLGGAIAEAQNEQTAQEIAKRCDVFDEVTAALDAGLRMREAQARYFQDRRRENLIASKEAEREFDQVARAALARAKGSQA